MRQRVAADEAADPLAQAEVRDDRLGEALRLVGDDADRVAPLTQGGEVFGHAVEQAAQFGALAVVVRAVDLEGFVDRLGLRGFAVGQALAEGAGQQRPRAVAQERAHPRGFERRQVVVAAHVVRRRGDVGQCVGERAVEIEQVRGGGWHVGTVYSASA